MNISPKARVFISCGQQKDTDEIEIARKIANKLESIGFNEPYIAVEEQTLKGLKENIFQKLSESEYFIFIDLKRERLFRLKNGRFKDTGKHRGSLFSHQELAIATFLDIDLDIEVLLLREKDVKEDDGILAFLQGNCIEFADRHLLPDVVAEKIRERKWNTNWRNELILERDERGFQDLKVRPNNTPARFFHIKVKNLHQHKIARDCVAYLERIENLLTGEAKPLELAEFKWKGVTTPRVAIPPNKPRYLDAFHMYYVTPTTVYLAINHTIVDYTGYYQDYTLIGPSTYALTYVVFSENFSPARATFRLNIGHQLDDIEFYAYAIE